MKKLIILNIALSILCLTSCINQERKKHENARYELKSNVIIDHEGVYCSKEQKICLEIKIDNSIVKYTLRDSLNNVVFQSKNPTISNFQRWGFLLDYKGNIWICSSDIGLYILKKAFDGKYDIITYDIIDNNNVNGIPKEIFNILPSSIKKGLNRVP